MRAATVKGNFSWYRFSTGIRRYVDILHSSNHNEALLPTMNFSILSYDRINLHYAVISSTLISTVKLPQPCFSHR